MNAIVSALFPSRSAAMVGALILDHRAVCSPLTGFVDLEIVSSITARHARRDSPSSRQRRCRRRPPPRTATSRSLSARTMCAVAVICATRSARASPCLLQQPSVSVDQPDLQIASESPKRSIKVRPHPRISRSRPRSPPRDERQQPLFRDLPSTFFHAAPSGFLGKRLLPMRV